MLFCRDSAIDIDNDYVANRDEICILLIEFGIESGIAL